MNSVSEIICFAYFKSKNWNIADVDITQNFKHDWRDDNQ